MGSEFRSPRSLAQWFDLDYFQRRTLFRGLWDGLPLLVFICSLFLLGAMLWAAGNRTFQSGPLSTPHAAFNDRCEWCHQNHGATLTRLWLGDSVGSVPDEACKNCHAGSHHHVNAPMDRCVSCHKEHRGHHALVRIDDRKCVECHGDLTLEDGRHSSVAAFAEGKHPPFRSLTDPGTIRFNHESHLNLKELRGVQLQLDCADCHQLDEAGKRFQPISYEQHCKVCHPIAIRIDGGKEVTDAEVKQSLEGFAKEPLPHPAKGQTTAVVRAAIRDRLARFIREPGREQFLKTQGETGRLPLPTDAPREEREFAWVHRMTDELERMSFDAGGGCRFCHAQTDPAKPFEIPPAGILTHWWTQSVFRHDAHRMMQCNDCHPAGASNKSDDVLLPSMATCLECHDRTRTRGTARSDCVQCHVYHDPQSQRAGFGQGKWTIDELLRTGR